MFIDILFYAVFLSQIFLLSYHYPKKFHGTIEHVLNTYPASDYPKLYQHSQYVDPAHMLKQKIRRFKLANTAIAVFGLAILFAMLVSGYAPHTIKENQHLMFVMIFFMLQALPHLALELSMRQWYKGMRNTAKTKTRTADLHPRRLFDFISPLYLIVAVLAYIAWVVYYLYNKGFTTAWDWQTLVTMLGMSAMNVLFFTIAYRALRGKKMDPHQAAKDQHKYAETVIRVCVFASILMSLQLFVFDAINQNGWDMFEPLAMSLYFQLVIIFGLGEMIRSLKVENIDFDVYKDAPLVSA